MLAAAGRQRPGGRPPGRALRHGGGCVPEAARDGRPAGGDRARPYATLVSEAEGLLSMDDTAAAMARWQSLSREARGHASSLSTALPTGRRSRARLAAVSDALTAREAARDAARRETLAKAQQSAPALLQRLVGTRAPRRGGRHRHAARGRSPDARHRRGPRRSRQRWHRRREIAERPRRCAQLQEQLAPRVRELREMDEWRRFANAQRQEQLIAMAEAIVASLKTERTSGQGNRTWRPRRRALRELHTKWQEVAEAPRNRRSGCGTASAPRPISYAPLRDVLRRSCATSATPAWKRRRPSSRKPRDWPSRQTGRRPQPGCRNCRRPGRTPAPRRSDTGRELAHRFRAAMQHVLRASPRRSRRRARRCGSRTSPERKPSAPAPKQLAASTEWESAPSEMKRMQAEWKTIGPVRRNKSEESLEPVPRRRRQVLRALPQPPSHRARGQARRA